MPEQVCSGIFYIRWFLKITSIVKILYKAEATNPEAELRENITLDIKDGAALKRPRPHFPTSHYTTLPCSGLHTTRYSTVWHDFARYCTARHYNARHHIAQHRDAWRRATWFCIARHYSSWHYSAWHNTARHHTTRRYTARDHATRHFLDNIILSCIAGGKNYVISVLMIFHQSAKSRDNFINSCHFIH